MNNLWFVTSTIGSWVTKRKLVYTWEVVANMDHINWKHGSYINGRHGSYVLNGRRKNLPSQRIGWKTQTQSSAQTQYYSSPQN